MAMQFIEECNYIKEINIFLYRYFNDESINNLHEHLKKKSGYTKEVKFILDEMEVIYNEILSQIEIPENLSMYFVNFNEEESLVFGLGNCILAKSYFIQEKNIQKNKDIIKENFKKDNGRGFLNCLKIEIFDVEENPIPLSENEFMQFLDETTTIKDSMKWKIFRIYSEFNKHVDILLDYFKVVYPIFENVYENHKDKFLKFNNFWKEAQEKGEWKERLKAVTELVVTEENSEVILRPSWMGCNSVETYGETWEHLNFYVGLMFTDFNFFTQENITQEEICSRLKLLGDPSKYEILKLIKEEGKYGSQLADCLNLTTATISHHMSILINSGFVTLEKDVNRIYYHSNRQLLARSLDQLRKDLCED